MASGYERDTRARYVFPRGFAGPTASFRDPRIASPNVDFVARRNPRSSCSVSRRYDDTDDQGPVETGAERASGIEASPSFAQRFDACGVVEHGVMVRGPFTSSRHPNIESVKLTLPYTEIGIGEFTDELGMRFEVQMQCVELTKQPLVVLQIDSPGGMVDVLCGILDRIANAQARGITVVTVARGIAASCAGILLGMGSHGRRYASPGSKILLHEISAGLQGNVNAMARGLDDLTVEMAALFRRLSIYCGQDPEHFWKIIRQGADSWMTADLAKTHGLVDQIGLPVVNQNITVAYTIADPTPPSGNRDQAHAADSRIRHAALIDITEAATRDKLLVERPNAPVDSSSSSSEARVSEGAASPPPTAHAEPKQHPQSLSAQPFPSSNPTNHKPERSAGPVSTTRKTSGQTAGRAGTPVGGFWEPTL